LAESGSDRRERNPGPPVQGAEKENSRLLTGRRDGDLVILRFRGYLSRRAGRELVGLARQLMNGGGRELLIDLEGCDLVNHEGIAELFALEELIGNSSGSISFHRMSATVETVFRIMGLDRFALLESSGFGEESKGKGSGNRPHDVVRSSSW
jgi:anti-anti-sigma regulatory factor